MGAEVPSFREALADGLKAVPFQGQRFEPRQADTGVVKKAEVVNLVPAHEPCRSTEATSALFPSLLEPALNCVPARPAMRPDSPRQDRHAT